VAFPKPEIGLWSVREVFPKLELALPLAGEKIEDFEGFDCFLRKHF